MVTSVIGFTHSYFLWAHTSGVGSADLLPLFFVSGNRGNQFITGKFHSESAGGVAVAPAVARLGAIGEGKPVGTREGQSDGFVRKDQGYAQPV